MMKILFNFVLEMSLSGSAVILAVLVCRALLGRCPKKVTIFLWLPAALQLILPVSLPSAVSFFNLLPRGTVRQTGTLLQEAVSAPENFGMTAEPVLTETIVPAAPDDSVQIWTGIGIALWILGMAAMVVWAAVQYGRLAGKMKTAVRMDGERNVYQSENIASPFILGVLRPKIYVPYHMDSVSARQVLLHERTHLRLCDHLTKLFAFCILTLHWFNPLCWLAFVLFGRDMEMRCDEAVLAHTEPEEYSTALVRLAVERRYFVTGPLAFGETSVKERVKHILAWKKPTLWITVTAVVLCAVVGIVCATDAAESPYEWTSTVTAEDFAKKSVIYHGEGAYDAYLTEVQMEELAECLRNVPESAMYIGKTASRSFSRDIRLVLNNGILRWDGENVMQMPAVSNFTIKPTWYLDDQSLRNFFVQLEKSILAGQGTLIEESVPVSVSVTGSDTVIAPKKYTAGTWEHQYDELPVLTMADSGVLKIDAYWRPETLEVYEEYYHRLSADVVTIEKNDLTAKWDAHGEYYTLKVTRKNTRLSEKAIYYITNGDEKYIFKVEFPAYSADLPDE